MALAKKHRLLKKDIESVFKRGKTVQSSFFFICFLENDLSYARIAAIIPKKVLKKSADRNRLKRIITETIRSGQFLKKSFDVTIVTTASIVEKQPKEIKREVEQTINKLFSQMK